MDIIWTKVIVAVLFGLLRLTFGLLPIKLYSYLKIWEHGADGVTHINRERQKSVECFLTLVQSFGGGVLFATCFLHMMPEVYHAVHELEEHFNLMRQYPISQLIICIGFFMIYFVEEFAQFMVAKVGNSEPLFEKSGTPSTISHNSVTNKVTPTLIDVKSSFEEKKVGCYEDKVDEQDEKSSNEDSVDSGLDKSNEEINIPMPTPEKELILELEKSPSKMLRCCLITMALSFHAIFEGIAIGLQNSVTNIWYIFIAISIHSVTLLFCVGVELVFSHKRPIVIFYFIFVLSMTSPIGIIIGLAVTQHADEESMATAIASMLLEGLSAGTMLYITFFEVLTREKEKRELRFRRGMAIITGFVIMALLQALD